MDWDKVEESIVVSEHKSNSGNATNSYLEAIDFSGLIDRSMTWDRQRSKVSPDQLANTSFYRLGNRHLRGANG